LTTIDGDRPDGAPRVFNLARFGGDPVFHVGRQSKLGSPQKSQCCALSKRWDFLPIRMLHKGRQS
jgi:hypothetical protein